MNLRQLRYITEVAKQGLNVSAAAETLYTSQPGVSKQIRQLEEELGVQIFERTGKQFTRVTLAGQAIIALASRTLAEADGIRQAAQEYSEPRTGKLAVATTHTQARYVLPPVVQEFLRGYGRVALQLHEGAPTQVADLVHKGVADFAIATEALEHFDDLVMMPCYHWHRAIIVPPGHPLLDEEALTLEAVARHRLVTYGFAFTGNSMLDRAFRRRGLTPRLAFTAADTDVIKTYVRVGLGVGIIAKLAYDPELDKDLHLLDASHLVEPSTTKIGFRRGSFLRQYMYEFIELFAPHLTREVVESCQQIRSRRALDAVFVDTELPVY